MGATGKSTRPVEEQRAHGGDASSAKTSAAKTLLLGFLSFLAVFCLIEAGLRVIDSIRIDLASAGKPIPGDVSASSILSTDIGWARRPRMNGPDVDGIVRHFDAQGYFTIDSAKLADPARKKILFIGDSNTYGFGVPPSQTFAELAGELVPQAAAIDAGVNGYSSFQGDALLRKLLPAVKPAVIVASFNFDDRREIFDGQGPDSRDYFAKVFRAEQNRAGKISDALDIFHFYRALRGGMTRFGLLPPAARNFRIDQLRPRVSEADYGGNLASIAAQARQAGVPLIFIVLRDNPLQAGFLDKAIERLQASDFDAAIEYLEPVVRSGSWFSDLAAIYLAQAYAAKGDRARAASVLTSSEPKRSIQGGRPIRLDSIYNQVMREVARQNGMPVVEAAAELEKDPYVYTDFCHFGSLGHKKVAELLAPRIVEAMEASKTDMGH